MSSRDDDVNGGGLRHDARSVSFLPAMVARRLATQSTHAIPPGSRGTAAATAAGAASTTATEAPPFTPHSHALRGFLFFLDISGYTKLTERLARTVSRKHSGAEVVGDLLTDYFTRLLDIVARRWGGDVIKFAGDALLCVFDDEAGSIELARQGKNTESGVAVAGPQERRPGNEKAGEDAAVQFNALSVVKAALEAAKLTYVPAKEKLLQVGIDDEPSEYLLSCRVALAYGPMELLTVGTADRCEAVLVGEVLNDIGPILDATDGQAVGLSSSARAMLPADAESCGYVLERRSLKSGTGGDARDFEIVRQAPEIRPSHSGARLPALPLASVPADAVERKRMIKSVLPFLPSPARQDVSGELRAVTVLFFSFPDVPSAGCLQATQSATQIVTEELHQRGATLRQAIFDDKGFVVIGVFGLRGTAETQSEDGGTAVGCAVAAVSRLRLAKVRTFVGVATGRVFAGVVGSVNERREYCVVGDTVNTAARLMGAARKGVSGSTLPIVVDQSTHDLETAGSSMSFDPLPALILKGKAAPVPVFKPRINTLQRQLSMRSTASAAEFSRRALRGNTIRRVFGRDVEQSAIGKLLTAYCAGKEGAMLLVEGAAGIGKSTLLWAAIENANLESSFIGVFCRASGSVSAGRPWADFFEVALPGSPKERAEAAVALLLDGGFEDSVEVAGLLQIVGIPCTESDLCKQLTADVRFAEAKKTVLRLVSALCAAHGRLVIAFEDLHFADDLSLDIFSQLQPSSELFLFASIRPIFPVPEELGLAIHRKETVHLKLLPLGGPEIESVAAQSLGVATIGRRFSDMLRDKAQGNPFFARELSVHLKTQEMLDLTGFPKFAELADSLTIAEVPITIERLLSARVDILSELSKRVLKLAAVIGNEFLAGDIAACFSAPSRCSHPEDVVGLLQEAGDIVAVTDSRRGEFQFSHAMVRDAVYSMLSGAERRSLHERVAISYEARLLESGGSEQCESGVVEALAVHWLSASQPLKAVLYICASAIAAQNSGLTGDCLSWCDQFDTAMAMIGPKEDASAVSLNIKLGILACRVTALSWLGRADETSKYLDENRHVIVQWLNEGGGDYEHFLEDYPGDLRTWLRYNFETVDVFELLPAWKLRHREELSSLPSVVRHQIKHWPNILGNALEVWFQERMPRTFFTAPGSSSAGFRNTQVLLDWFSSAVFREIGGSSSGIGLDGHLGLSRIDTILSLHEEEHGDFPPFRKFRQGLFELMEAYKFPMKFATAQVCLAQTNILVWQGEDYTDERLQTFLRRIFNEGEAMALELEQIRRRSESIDFLTRLATLNYVTGSMARAEIIAKKNVTQSLMLDRFINIEIALRQQCWATYFRSAEDNFEAISRHGDVTRDRRSANVFASQSAVPMGFLRESALFLRGDKVASLATLAHALSGLMDGSYSYSGFWILELPMVELILEQLLVIYPLVEHAPELHQLLDNAFDFALTGFDTMVARGAKPFPQISRDLYCGLVEAARARFDGKTGYSVVSPATVAKWRSALKTCDDFGICHSAIHLRLALAEHGSKSLAEGIEDTALALQLAMSEEPRSAERAEVLKAEIEKVKREQEEEDFRRRLLVGATSLLFIGAVFAVVRRRRRS